MSSCTADWGNHSETNPLARPDSHETSTRAMSSGNAPKSAGDGCAGKDGMADGMARARKKKRAPDQWQMLIVSKHMQNAAGGHHQQPPCSFSSKEVAEPQPALDPGEESDTGSCYSDDPGSDNQRLRDEQSGIANRLANEQQVCHRCLPKLCLYTNLYVSVGSAPSPQTRDAADNEPCMLEDLQWGTKHHQEVMDNYFAFMQACHGAQAALGDDLQEEQECVECDEEELRAATPMNVNDTTSSAYMEAQRQMLYAQEHAAKVDPEIKDMLHTDVHTADDSMEYNEAVRCVLEETSHLFHGTRVECMSRCVALVFSFQCVWTQFASSLHRHMYEHDLSRAGSGSLP